jgi:hypothetical protein
MKIQKITKSYLKSLCEAILDVAGEEKYLAMTPLCFFKGVIPGYYKNAIQAEGNPEYVRIVQNGKTKDCNQVFCR